MIGRREPRSPFHSHYMREVHHLPCQSIGITVSDPDPLRRISISKTQKWIGTGGREILCVPRTRRVSHVIRGRPNQDALAQKQERKNAEHRTIEGKNSSGD